MVGDRVVELPCPERYDLVQTMTSTRLGPYDPSAELDGDAFWRATRSPKSVAIQLRRRIVRTQAGRRHRLHQVVALRTGELHDTVPDHPGSLPTHHDIVVNRVASRG